MTTRRIKEPSERPLNPGLVETGLALLKGCATLRGSTRTEWQSTRTGGGRVMEEGLGREAKYPRKLTFWDVEAVIVREVVGEMKTVANLEDISEKKEQRLTS